MWYNIIYMLAAIYGTSSSWGGNYRCGLCGTDLNRQWKQPNQVLHSSVRLSEEDEESTQVLYWILLWTYVAWFFFESQSMYTDIYCVYYIFIHIFCSVGYTWLHDCICMFDYLCTFMFFLSMILPILKPNKIPRVSKSCQLHWAFGQGTQAEEIGCSAMSVGGICCIVLSMN